MSAAVAGISCQQCQKSFFNEQQKINHDFLQHTLPGLFKEGDKILNELRKAYAYHMVRGECPTHGSTDAVCIHPDMESKMGELVLYCYPCILKACHYVPRDHPVDGDKALEH